MNITRNPALAALNDEEFIAAFNAEGPKKLGVRLGVTRTVISSRMYRLRRFGHSYTGYSATQAAVLVNEDGGCEYHPERQTIEVPNGVVVVFSDCHYWPDTHSTMHDALVKMINEFQPAAIICNGDAVDMAAVSRHPPIGWEKQPTVQQEIECTQNKLAEIMKAAPSARRIWNLGNHDGRFETRLALHAPEYAKITGTHLSDHFPDWERAWSTWINNDVVVKHRFKGGEHATFQNAVKSGKTLITGHLHNACVTPFSDYNGTRYGVDTGCIADAYGVQFVDYTEDNPRNWRSGFGVLTFSQHKLLMPELVTLWDRNYVQFRGKVIAV